VNEFRTQCIIEESTPAVGREVIVTLRHIKKAETTVRIKDHEIPQSD